MLADERGMGRYVRAVLRRLAARPDIELTLLVRSTRNPAPYRAIAGGRVAVAPVATARGPGEYDCVWYPWNGVRFRARAPALVTINDDFAFAYPARGYVARRREQGPIENAIREAAHIVTISNWSRDVLRARFALPAARISTIPLAPDAAFCPGPATSPFDEPFIVAVGTGEARKNIALLVNAAALAFPRGEARLVLVGAPDRRLRAQTDGPGALPLTILSNIDDAALQRLYRTAAAVAVPSLAEGFGLVAVEAQACGAAVIAARTSALPEAVGEAGVLLDPGDLLGWRDTLRAFVENAALRMHYRALSAARWTGTRGDATCNALLVAFERLCENRA